MPPRANNNAGLRVVKDVPTGGGGGDGGGGNGGGAWMNRLSHDKNKIASTVHNLATILQFDNRWSHQLPNGERQRIIAYDAFAQRLVFLSKPPFIDYFLEHDISVNHNPQAATSTRTTIQRFIGKEITDVDMTRACTWMEANYRALRPSSANMSEAMELIGQTQKRHPVREFIMSVQWDGKDRIGCLPDPNNPGDKGSVSWLTTYFGAPDTPYIRRIGRYWPISAVARVMQPGCQADYALVFEGLQGVGKSSGLRALFEPWFTEDLGNLNNMKEAQQQIAGIWGIEIAEMDAFSRAGDSAMKKFMTQPSDRYRPPYGRRPQDYPRQCVFAGTTNRDHYFTDATGNRRYWPFRCSTSNVDELRADRAQIWAQALLLWQAGIRWWPQSDEVVDLQAEQEARMEHDPWMEPIREWLTKRALTARQARQQGHLERAENLDGCTQADVLLSALEMKQERWGMAESKRVARILSMLGYVRVTRTSALGARSAVYIAGPDSKIVVDEALGESSTSYSSYTQNVPAAPAAPAVPQGTFPFENAEDIDGFFDEDDP